MQHAHQTNYHYRYVPKFSDRQVCANSVDPDQTAPRGAFLSGSTLFTILSALFGYILCVNSYESYFRIITVSFSGVRNFRSFMAASHKRFLGKECRHKSDAHRIHLLGTNTNFCKIVKVVLTRHPYNWKWTCPVP